MAEVSLSRNDLNVLEKIKDPDFDPAAIVMLDQSLPRDPHITDSAVYERVIQIEREIILSMQQLELQLAGLKPKTIAKPDLLPTRLRLTWRLAREFVKEYFEQNPISQMGIVGMRDGVAVRVSEMGGNPVEHVEAINKWAEIDPQGSPSLQNALEMCRGALFHAPSHGTREVLVVYGALLSSDPGDIHDTIANLLADRIRVSIVGLAAQVAICEELCRKTNAGDATQYNIALDEMHYRELLLRTTTPPVTRTQAQSTASLLMMGHAPSHGTREVLVVYGALLSSDPGDIHDTIANLLADRIRVSIVGLAAQVAICEELCRKTNAGDATQYNIALDEMHYRELLLRTTTPPVTRTQAQSTASLLMMGFPSRTLAPADTTAYCACHNTPVREGYLCTRCGTRVCRLPAECPACGLTLILSTHLARSYHHLFPLRNWVEVPWARAAASRACYSCLAPFPDPPAQRRGHRTNGTDGKRQGDGGDKEAAPVPKQKGPACGLTLILSTHLARSYHHLFPLRNWVEVPWARAAASRACCACLAPFPDPPPQRRGHRTNGTDGGDKEAAPVPKQKGVSESSRYACQGTVSNDTFKEPSQREDSKKTVKKVLEERYTSGKNRWFFTPLKF
ncbi:hypothetical protein BN1723_004447 [Verticillium longisporum]|uniref:Ssl1-like domain-containing protein n=1 Tax=Verticillium longisporum TaxID=100787 RepID=A0A0G4MX45_VERLO|nr:hypothetical protein BN1723_004447 [Verticillium longisporum]